MLETQYRVYDCLLAVGYSSCFLIGFPGNCLALKYFSLTKKRNLSTLLFIVACSIDILSSVIHLPVAVNLFNKRKPGVMESDGFCSLWYFLLLSVQLMSMYVVMLMSISRTILIIFPFYRLRKNVILTSIPVYFIFQAILTVLYFLTSYNYYSFGMGYCTRTAGDLKPITVKNIKAVQQIQALYYVLYCICAGIPPVVVFLSLLASVISLRSTMEGGNTATAKNNRQTRRDNRKARASMTIMLFAATFLLCNMFTFVNNFLYTLIHIFYDEYPGQVYSSTFMFFYSWSIAEIFCPVLNAALNPLLYLWRMKHLRAWVLGLFTGISSTPSDSTFFSNTAAESQYEVDLKTFTPDKQRVNSVCSTQVLSVINNENTKNGKEPQPTSEV